MRFGEFLGHRAPLWIGQILVEQRFQARDPTSGTPCASGAAASPSSVEISPRAAEASAMRLMRAICLIRLIFFLELAADIAPYDYPEDRQSPPADPFLRSHRRARHLRVQGQ